MKSISAYTAGVMMLIVGLSGISEAQPALSPGDIAIVHLDTRHELLGAALDGFSFVPLVDVSSGTTLHFTNAGWQGAGGFRPGEESVSIRFLVEVPAGLVLSYRAGALTGILSDNVVISGSIGDLSDAGDQIIAYQQQDQFGSSVLRFLYAVSTTPFSDATDAHTTALPPRLDEGATAIHLGASNGSYTGSLVVLDSGTRGELLLAIGAPGNWTTASLTNLPAFGIFPAVFVVQSATGREGTATVVGREGWRMIAPPGTGLTVGTLAPVNLVAGIPGSWPEFGRSGGLAPFPTVFTGYNGYYDDSDDYQDHDYSSVTGYPCAACFPYDPDLDNSTSEGGYRYDTRPANALGYTPPHALTDALTPGKGALWYMFDMDNFGGDSRRLPVLLPAVGGKIEDDVTVSFTTAERVPADPTLSFFAGPSDGSDDYDDQFLLGNPFQSPFDLSGLSQVSGAGTLKKTVAFWNPNAGVDQTDYSGPGSYVLRTAIETSILVAGTTFYGDVLLGVTFDDLIINVVDDDVQVWQGFIAEVEGSDPADPPTFSFDADYRRLESDPTFYGLTADASGGASQKQALTAPEANEPLAPAQGGIVSFMLRGETLAGVKTYDAAAHVLFAPEAAFGPDAYDFSKPQPLAETRATVAPMGLGADGHLRARALEALPLALAAPHTVPLELSVDAAGTYALGWDASGLPAGWSATLYDEATGETIVLDEPSSATLALSAGTTHRFSLRIDPDGHLHAGTPLAAGLEVSTPAPNPAVAETRVTVQSTGVQPLTASVYDALGRRVALVFEGTTGPEAPINLRVQTATLASGVYTLRVEGATESVNRRFTVVR